MRELLEVYATPFEAAIREAKLASIMNAYSEIDGIPLGSSRELLSDLLRRQLGFEGVVVSDYFTVQTLFDYHCVAADKAEAARMALEAGLDVELPTLDCYGAPLREVVEKGDVDPGLLDAAVSRVLEMKFQLGLFDDPYVDSDTAPEVFDTPEQRALAHEIARKSIVLLKNEGGLLPLSPSLSSVAVVGPCADSTRLLQGDYHFPAHLEVMYGLRHDRDMSPRPDGETNDLSGCCVPMVTPLEGIKAKVGKRMAVFHAVGCDITGGGAEGIAEAVRAVKQAEVAVVAVGDRSGLVEGCTSGESIDRSELGLPGHQQELVEAVAATGKPIVVVLINGRPMALSWIAQHIPAVVEAWQPGEEAGTAIADVLFGDYNPAGRLPISFPAAVGQVPVYYSHKPSGGRSQWKGDYADGSAKPLFPFGHGLSFTHFDYHGLQIDPERAGPSETVSIRAEIGNGGERRGEEVVQLYVRDAVATVSRPVKELRGFVRVELAPGQRKTVTFQLPVSHLGFYDRKMRFVVEPGKIEVMVGGSCEHIRLRGSFEITGKTTEVERLRRFLTPALVS
jgi:beta-glucosidase